MKTFLKIFVIVFLIDIILGFSMTSLVNGSEPNLLFKIIDEIISFPTTLWNRLVPEKGIYASTTSVFWLVIIVNTLLQTLVVFGFIRLLKTLKSRNL